MHDERVCIIRYSHNWENRFLSISTGKYSIPPFIFYFNKISREYLVADLGKYLMVTDLATTEIYEIQSQKSIIVIPNQEGNVIAFAISDDCNRCLFLVLNENCELQIQVWNTNERNKPTKIMTIPVSIPYLFENTTNATNTSTYIDFTPDNRYIIACFRGSDSAFIWDTEETVSDPIYDIRPPCKDEEGYVDICWKLPYCIINFRDHTIIRSYDFSDLTLEEIPYEESIFYPIEGLHIENCSFKNIRTEDIVRQILSQYGGVL